MQSLSHSCRARAGIFVAALAAITAPFFPPPAAALPVLPDRGVIAASEAAILRVRDICDVEYEGRTRITHYCDDPYVCDHANPGKCKPGPELQRQLDEERQRREDEVRAQQQRLEQMQRDMEARMRDLRRTARSSYFPQSGGTTRYDDRRASCSDITGLGGSSAPTTCSTGGRMRFVNPGSAEQQRRPITTVRTTMRNTIQIQYDVVLPMIEKRDALPPNDPQREALNRQIRDEAAKAKSSGSDIDDWVNSKMDAPRNASGASEMPQDVANADTPTGFKPHWKGTEDPADCDMANEIEKNTAAWYDSCVDDPPAKEPSWSRRPSNYLPPLDPHKEISDDQYAALQRQCSSFIRDPGEVVRKRCLIDAAFNQRAKNRCQSKIPVADPGQSSGLSGSWADWSTCIEDAKLDILMGEVPDIASRCAAGDRDNRISCADYIYVFGPPEAPAEGSLRDRLRKRLAKKSDPNVLSDRSWYSPHEAPDLPDPPEDWLTRQRAAQLSKERCPPAQSMNQPGRCCPPGQGMKPTPGAFGAWSCQALGGFSADDVKRLLSGENNDASVDETSSRDSANVSVPSVRVREPQIRAPEVRVPEVGAPKVRVPEVGAPEVRVPEVRVPDPKVRAPAPKTPTPNVRVPEAKQPAANTPETDEKEIRLSELARFAAQEGVEIAGGKMSAKDRKTCVEAAFGSAHSVLKGGAAPVPDVCHSTARAARAVLVHYARAHVSWRAGRGVEDILLSLAAPKSAGGTSVAERKAPPPSAREEADCYRQTLSDDQGGGFFSRLFGSLFGRSSVPDYCQPYLRQPERAGGPKPAPGAARLQLSADDMDEVRKLAAEFKRDDLLPPDFAGGKSGE